MRRWSAAMAVVALVLVAAGCGDGEDRPAGTRTAVATTPTTPSAPTTTSTVRQRGPQSETERVGDCLKKEGYRLQGGPVRIEDAGVPEYEILFSSTRGGGFIGFYENAARAKRVARQLRKNARRFSGAAIERRGAINIVWVDLSQPDARASVRACLVT